MNKIKVGYVISSLGCGGVEKYVVDLANRLDCQKFSVVIFTFREGELAASVGKDVKIINLGKKRKGNDFLLPFRLGRSLRKENIDVVHSNNWSTFLETVMARRMAAVPLHIHAQHGVEMNDSEAFSNWKRNKRNRIRQICSFFTDRLVAVSKATSTFMCQEWRVSEHNVQLIYNGVDLDLFNIKSSQRNFLRNLINIKENDCVIGSVGRLMQVKNYPCLVKSFAKCQKKQPRLKLLLVGDGPEKENVQVLTKELNVENNVILLGRRSDVQELLTVMDIFVLPSFSEGVSLALLEAMACGLPVIATDVGGNPEVVEHNNCGYLVKSDNPEDMANAINKLISQPEKTRGFANTARKRVETMFSMKTMVTSYENLYLNLLP